MQALIGLRKQERIRKKCEIIKTWEVYRIFQCKDMGSNRYLLEQSRWNAGPYLARNCSITVHEHSHDSMQPNTLHPCTIPLQTRAHPHAAAHTQTQAQGRLQSCFVWKCECQAGYQAMAKESTCCLSCTHQGEMQEFSQSCCMWPYACLAWCEAIAEDSTMSWNRTHADESSRAVIRGDVHVRVGTKDLCA